MKTLILIASLIGSASLSQEVNIYSSRQPDLIDPILEAFTAETGIEVNVVFIKSGMLERLRAEGRRSRADIILTSDIANLDAAANAGLTQAVVSQTINATIPQQYRDPDGQWFGLTTRARIFYISRDRVQQGEITSYEQLADENWRGRVCSRSGLHDYNIALVAAFLARYSEAQTIEWLQGVKDNLARRPQGNDRAQVKAIWAGECDIAIGYTYYMGKMLADPEQAEWANAVDLVFPTLDNAGTHINLSGMAMTKAAPNPQNALALMEFLTSARAQSIYAQVNFEYPLRPDTPASDLVASWGSFTPDPTPMIDIAKLRGRALQIMEIVDFDG